MSKHDFTDRDPIAERARALPTAITPPNDLWPDIQHHVRHQQATPSSRSNWPTRQWTTLRLATAALLLVGISSATTLWFTNALQSVPVAAQSAPVAPFGPWYASSTDIVQARTDMLLIVQDELAQLSPETRVVVANNLKSIEVAQRDINTALRSYPNSELLQQLLLSVYTNELTLLSDIRGMTRTAKQRTQL